jgi:Sec-independent protein secretion pathway component TatC
MLVLRILRNKFLQLKNHIWITYVFIIGINDTIVDVIEYNMLMLLLTLLCDASVMFLTLSTLQMNATLHIKMWRSTQEHTKIL